MFRLRTFQNQVPQESITALLYIVRTRGQVSLDNRYSLSAMLLIVKAFSVGETLSEVVKDVVGMIFGQYCRSVSFP